MGLPHDGARSGSGPRFRQRALTGPFAGLRRARTRWRALSGNARLTVCVVAAGILVLLWTALPFFWIVWVSFMTKAEVVEGIVQTIDAPTLDNYMRIIGIAETDALFGGHGEGADVHPPGRPVGRIPERGEQPFAARLDMDVAEAHAIGARARDDNGHREGDDGERHRKPWSCHHLPSPPRYC